MTAYEDTFLAARFAALAPAPLRGDWEDVLVRAGAARQRSEPRLRRRAGLSRRRRRLLVLAAAALVVVLVTASAFGMRAFLSATGLVGLAPVGATPSTPARGELLLDIGFGHSWGDPGRFHVKVYADGRMLTQRIGDYTRTDELRESTGLLERRLTPEGVERVTAEVLATGLIDRDLHLTSGEGLYFGFIDFRAGEERVRITWGDDDIRLLDVASDVSRTTPTPEQASALMRLDERLADPESWLPASAWKRRQPMAFVPSMYSVCYQGARGVELSGVLALLPPRAADLLRAQENTPESYTNLAGTFVLWCSELTNAEARTLERILDDAGMRSVKDVFGLMYGIPGPGEEATELSLGFDPDLPHERNP